MHRCRHEQDDDPYASGAENRRQNRDRLNRDAALDDNIRHAIRGGYGPPFGGHVGIPGYPYGLGQGGYVHEPPFSLHSGHYHTPLRWDPWGPVFYSHPPSHDDDSDSDEEFPSSWYPPSPPPSYGTSPLCTSRRLRRSSCGGSHGRVLHNPYNDLLNDDHHRSQPRPYLLHMGYSY